MVSVSSPAATVSVANFNNTTINHNNYSNTNRTTHLRVYVERS